MANGPNIFQMLLVLVVDDHASAVTQQRFRLRMERR